MTAQRWPRRALILMAAVSTFFAMVGVSMSQEERGILEPAPVTPVTEQEIGLLPVWCPHTQLFSGDSSGHRYREWAARFGSDFEHMHHHCFGLVDAMRAERLGLTPHRRRALMTSAVGEFDYVLRNSKPGFSLRIDTLRAKAASLQRLGQYEGSLKTAMDLVREFPNAEEGYVAAASALMALKKPEEAAKAIDAGLERVADPERLRRVRSALTGR